MVTFPGRARFLPTVLLLFVATCHQGDHARGEGAACSTTSDCEPALTCSLDRCRALCERDEDCASGACVVIPDTAEPVCAVASESRCSTRACPDALACGRDDRCRTACRVQGDCPAGRMCVDGACFEDRLRRIVYAAQGDVTEVRTMDADGATQEVLFQLPPGSTLDFGLAVSPDGTRVFYATDQKKRYYEHDLLTRSTREVERLPKIPYAGGPFGWIDDATAWAVWRVEDHLIPLVRVSLTGGYQGVWVDPLVTGRPEIHTAALSPDRTRLALVANFPSNSLSQDVFVVDANGVSNPRTLVVDCTDPSTYDTCVTDGQPVWSPDGKDLYWLRATQSGLGLFPADLVRFDFDTGERSVVLSGFFAHPEQPWTFLDDRTILTAQQADLVRVDVSTGAVTNLTPTPDVSESFPVVVAPRCGNRLVQEHLGETCDEGPSNSDADELSCHSTCRRGTCWDGVVGRADLAHCLFAAPFSPVEVNAIGTHRIVAHDVDGDGEQDLLVPARDMTDVFLGRGGGRFEPMGPVVEGMVLGVSDVDGDGLTDLWTLPYDRTEVRLARGDGQGGFSVASSFTFPEGESPWTGTGLDLADDRALAVVSFRGEQAMGTLRVLRPRGAVLEEVFTTPLARVPLEIASGDVNADGHQDVAVMHGADFRDGTWVMLGDGTGRFVSALGSPYFVGDSAATGKLVRVDGDGHLDLVTGCAYDSHVRVLLGDGVGGFVEAAGSPVVAPEPFGIAVEDLDGDGDMDLVTTRGSGFTLSLFEGDGAGTFVELFGSPLDRFSAPGAPLVVDLDGNGFADLVVPEKANQIQVLLSMP